MKKVVLALLVLFTLILTGCSAAYKVEFPAEELSVSVGDVFTPEVIVRPGRFDYELYSSNNTILTVRGKEVEALKTGVATLTAQSGEKTDTVTVYVLSEGSVHIGDPTFPDASYVYFSVINYAAAQLENPIIRSFVASAGTDITESFPGLTGYKLTWYTDETRQQEITGRVICGKGKVTYYAYAQAEYNNVLTENGLVTGLTYPNLDHSTYAFPDSYNDVPITGIADYAFYGDTTLETIVIPMTYTYIGKFAFAGCTKLKSVRFAEGSRLTEIGDFAFGPTYTEPKEEEKEEAPDDDVLAYLDSLLDSVGLTQLKTQNTDTQSQEISINEDYCAALTDITLPASVKKVGSYAFYNCSGMSSALPAELEEIDYGAFRGSKITSADLTNVKKIGAYAFYDCKDLATVTNASGVEECGGYAFYGTKLYNEQNAANSVIYADTMVVGNAARNTRAALRFGTTLIADYAFNSVKNETLTLLFNKGDHVRIGWQAFYVTGYEYESSNHPLFSKNVFLAVGEGEFEAYKNENPLLAERFFEREKKVIDGVDSVNYGEHSLFKIMTGDNAGKYVYDRFTVRAENGTFKSPTEIDLSLLADVVRINSYAFESIGRLECLRVPAGLKEIADCAVSNCGKLTLIDLTSVRTVPTLATSNAIQFSGLDSDCVVLVSESNYEVFRNRWQDRTTARSKLRYKKNVSLYVDGELLKTVEYCLPYAGLPQEEGIETWYTDSNCSVECLSIGESTELYAKTR